MDRRPLAAAAAAVLGVAGAGFGCGQGGEGSTPTASVRPPTRAAGVGLVVTPGTAGAHDRVTVTLRTAHGTGRQGDKQRGYVVEAHAVSPASGCVNDRDRAVADGPAGVQVSGVLDPSRGEGGPEGWCPGRFDGTVTDTLAYACPASSTCQGPRGVPARERVVSRFSFRVTPRRLDLTAELPETYRRVCAAQRAYAPAGARACPPLVPEGAVKVETAGPFSKREVFKGGWTTNFGSPSLDRLDGRAIETNGGHWRYDVTWSPAVRRLAVGVGIERPGAADASSSCRRERLAGAGVERCDVVPYERGGGLNGGHVAYVWDDGPVTYVVSVHGQANAPRARAMLRAVVEQHGA